jgi:restriction system protein
MDGCLKVLICLLTPPIGWIYLLWEGFEDLGNRAKIQEQKNYFNSLNPKTKEDLQKIDTMDGHTFEHYVAQILSKNGYNNVSVTSGSNDFGVDIIAHKHENKYAIQVKRQSSRVSRRAVSDAVAGRDHYGCNLSMVITNNYMTDGGMRLAKSTNCIIIDREKLISLTNTAYASSPSKKKEDVWVDIVDEQDIIKEDKIPNVSGPSEKEGDIWEDIVLEKDVIKK